MRRHSIIQNNMKKKTAAIFILIQEMKLTAVFFLPFRNKFQCFCQGIQTGFQTLFFVLSAVAFEEPCTRQVHRHKHVAAVIVTQVLIAVWKVMILQPFHDLFGRKLRWPHVIHLGVDQKNRSGDLLRLDFCTGSRILYEWLIKIINPSGSTR